MIFSEQFHYASHNYKACVIVAADFFNAFFIVPHKVIVSMMAALRRLFEQYQNSNIYSKNGNSPAMFVRELPERSSQLRCLQRRD
jgi:ssDNA-specific exonuclease RecJ